MPEIPGYRLALVCAFTSKGDPQAKQRPRTVRRKGINGKTQIRTYTPRETFDYEWKISRSARRCGKPGPGETLAPEGVPLYLVARFIFARPKYMLAKKYPAGLVLKCSAPDADNLLKSCADGIEKAANIVRNDSQFAGVDGLKFYAERGGEARTEIEVYTVLAEAVPAD